MVFALRCMTAVFTGMIVSFAFVVAVEIFSNLVHPLPPDCQGTMEELCQHVSRYPQWVLAVVVPVWAATAFVGTWVSGRMGNFWCALCTGLLLISAVAFNVSKLPYPMWFKLAILIAIPLAVALGSRVSIRRKQITRDELT